MTDNLIQNGGFEDNTLNDTGWGVFANIPGWTAIQGQIEIQEGSFEAGQPAGDAILELDANENSTVQQTVEIATEGIYVLSLDYAMRGTDPATNGFQVLIDGQVIDTINPATPGFQPYNLDLLLTAGSHTIAFVALGTSDGQGTFLNNVALMAEPAPPANLIINGGFEDTPALTRSGAIWDIFSDGEVTGWTGSNGVEIQAAGIAQGNASQITELDADANTTLTQTVDIPQAGTYRLTFEYAARDGDAATNGIEVTIGSQTFTLSDLTNVDYETFSVDIELPAGPATLSLAGTGTTDGRGTFVDNVALVAVDGGTGNNPPTVASTVDATLSEDDPGFTDVDLLFSATDPDGDDLEITNFRQASATFEDVGFSQIGTVLRIDHSSQNFLAAGESNIVVYDYDIIDGNGGSVAQTATITINGVNDAPVAVDDTATTPQNTVATIDALFNDMDPDISDTLTLDSVTDGTRGVASIVNNEIVYRPNLGAIGEDTISYTVSDGNGGTDTGEVVITIQQPHTGGGNLVVNGGFEDTPALTRDGAIWDIFSNGEVTGWAGSAGVEIQAPGIAQGNASQISELDADANTTLSQTIDIPEAGTYRLTFEYAARDGDAATNGVEIEIGGQTFQLTGITNPAYETYSVDVVLPAGPTELKLTGAGSSDGRGTFIDNVALALEQGVNESAVAVNDEFTFDADTAEPTFNVLTNDIGLGLEATTLEASAIGTPVTVTSANETGTAIIILQADGTLTVELSPAFAQLPLGQVDTFTLSYAIADNDAVLDTDGGEILLTVNGTAVDQNTPPVAIDDTAITDEDNAVTIDALFNDFDVDEDPLSLFFVSDGTLGTSEIVENEIVYTPNPGAFGQDTITYIVNDGNGGNDTGEVVITINEDTTPGRPELIVNGDFEDNPLNGPNPPNNGDWGLFAEIPGWVALQGEVEVHEASLAAMQPAGDAVVELDANANSTIQQTVNVTTAGNYALRLDYTMRGTDPATNGFEVIIDGEVVDTVNPTTPGFQPYEQTFVLTAGSHTIAFAGIGTSDGQGTFIDNVSLMETDLPPETELSFAGSQDAVVVDLAANTQIEAASLMTIGDSITRGFNDPQITPGGYRALLWGDLSIDRGLWVDFVGGENTNQYFDTPDGSNPLLEFHDNDHQGVNSITSQQVAADLPAVLASNPTDIALVMLGTNDVIFDADPVGTTPGEILAVLQALESANPDVEIYLAEITPRFDTVLTPFVDQEIIDQINAELINTVATAQGQGIDVTLVDTSSVLATDLSDTVHLTVDGTEKLTTAFLDALLAGSSQQGGTFGQSSPDAVAPAITDLFGSEAGDRLSGDAGANVISGAGGDDWITGRGGDDMLDGGAGRDIFEFGLMDGSNTITGFTTGAGPTSDILYFNSVADVVMSEQVGADAQFTFGETTVTVQGVSVFDVAFAQSDGLLI